MRSTFKLLFLVAIVLRSTVVAQAAVPASPNIIFVLTDDLGPGDIGVLWQNELRQDRRHRTPHLDKMAAEGAILHRHYSASPVCAPARSSLLTGQHQGHATVRDNQFDKELQDTHTLGTVLQAAGYATAVIGKWGLQGGPGWPGHPLNRGFDFFFGYIAHEDAHFHYPFESQRPFFANHTDISSQLQRSYSTDLLTARAKKWIQEQVSAEPEKPFFLYLAQVAPHAGLRVPTDSHLTAETNYPPGGGTIGGVQWLGIPGQMVNTASGNWDQGLHPEYAQAVSLDGQPWPDFAKRYATMVRRLDDSMADLIQLLKDLEIDDNTLIIFTSDNGTQNAPGLDNVGIHDPRFFQTYGPYDGIKRDLWEGGIRMPTLVRWPAGIPAGSHIHEPSQFHDWMATFAELAGVPAPAFSDGRSIVSHLTGSGDGVPGTVYTEYFEWNRTPAWTEFEPVRRNRLRQQMQAVYLGRYKGVRYNITSPTTPFLVYDVVDDVKETTNLAGQPGVPTQSDFLAASLRQRRIDPDAPRPYDTEPIPALKLSADSSAGLRQRSYPGIWPWVPQLNTRLSSNERMIDYPGAVGSASGPIARVLDGLLEVPVTGTYHFFCSLQGRAIIRLHNALLLDADVGYEAGTEIASGPIVLAAGFHPVTVTLVNAGEDPELTLMWQGPELAKSPVPPQAFSFTGVLSPPNFLVGDVRIVNRGGIQFVEFILPQAAPLESYQPQWSPDLADQNWTSIPAHQLLREEQENGETILSMPLDLNNNSRLFFRLRMLNE
ncbi:MAG: sulfatase-like hydrolase/transferase [Verrucomicrobia bacterium]|nr:sulfatase-like hydrolase/transferase [Verrucomicrobiota bacterium]